MRFSGSKHQSAIDQKNEAKMGLALGIDFTWIFLDFGRQVGAKLASTFDKKSIQKSIKNLMQKKNIWTRLGSVLEPSWRVWGGIDGRAQRLRGSWDP